MSKICLNMIVKNEEKVILRLLNSVVKLLDSYCICDTGSTDNTIKVIKGFFEQHNIPGKIVFEPFQDFGHNRTFALKECLNMENADYILLMDADMILHIDPAFSVQQIKQSICNYDAVYLFQGSDKLCYKNVRILKNRECFSYWGVTHEYVDVADSNAVYGVLNKSEVFIRDIGDGGSKSDKFARDIKLLKAGLEKIPDNDRYTFYLANSYKDSQQFDLAIEQYLNRIRIGGWYEEIWFSYYNIGHCYRDKGDMVNAIHYWMEAYNYFPKRIENLYEITGYYRNNGKNNLAYAFFVLADKQRRQYQDKNAIDFLFVQKDVYDYKIDYELTVIGYYVNDDKYDLCDYCMRVLSCPTPEDYIIRNIFSNYKFYTSQLIDIANPKEDLTFLNQLPRSSVIDDDSFNSSSPCVLFHNGEFYANIRYVNYWINDEGGYVQKENICTKNVLYTFNVAGNFWVQTDMTLLGYNTRLDNLYVGLEDMRIISFHKKLHYIANRGLSYNNISIEYGTVDSDSGKLKDSVILKKSDMREVEKNWVLFVDEKRDKLKCVYGWHPLEIGDINNDSYTSTHKIETPNFFRHMRCSSNGIKVRDELWFICHIVSYEDRRFYYHVLVALDPDTYQIKRYTRLFTFEKEKVEYTLGFVYKEKEDELLIGYSKMDKSTHFISVNREKMETLFWTAP